MNMPRIRALSKKLTPLVLAGLVVGGAGSVVAQRYFASDCCKPGASCCHPGSPCCHGHGHAGPQQGLAQQ
jgi:hypothetical protein